MTYTLDTSHTSPNQTAAANCPAAFGYPRNIIGTTIHHWDAKGSGANWNGTLTTLINDYRNPGSRGVSAHFMAETGRVACLVFPGDAAWHAGNPQGNAQTIGIELNPDESNGTYQTAAELIAQIWVDWGIPHKLYHHYEWTSTGCPGSYDLDRLGRMAETEYTKLTKGGVTPASTSVTPIPGGLFMSLTPAQEKLIFDRINAYVDAPIGAIPGKVTAAVLDEPITRAGVGGDTSLRKTASWLDANLAELSEDMDPKAIAAAIPATLAQQVITALSEKLAK